MAQERQKLEAIFVQDGEHEGVYLPEDYVDRIPYREKAIDEIIAGAAWGGTHLSREEAKDKFRLAWFRTFTDFTPNKVIVADDDKWAFVVGLLVCGLAEKVEI